MNRNINEILMICIMRIFWNKVENIFPSIYLLARVSITELWIGLGFERGTWKPPNWKKLFRNLVLFSMSLFLATTFPKLERKLFFQLNFRLENFKHTLKFSAPFLFSSNPQNNPIFLKISWNISETNAFLQCSYNLFANFRKFLSVPTIRVFYPNARKFNACL